MPSSVEDDVVGSDTRHNRPPDGPPGRDSQQHHHQVKTQHATEDVAGRTAEKAKEGPPGVPQLVSRTDRRDLVRGHTAEHAVRPVGPLSGSFPILLEFGAGPAVLYNIALLQCLALKLGQEQHDDGHQEDAERKQVGKEPLNHVGKLEKVDVDVVRVGDQVFHGLGHGVVFKDDLVEHLRDGHPEAHAPGQVTGDH